MDQEFRDLAIERIRLEARAVGAVAGVLNDVTDEILAVLYDCTGTVFTTGSGTSGTIARRMAHIFSVSGTPSMYMQPSDALHGGMGALRDRDVLIALLRGGGSDEINTLCSRAKDRGVRIVALTSEKSSELAQLADYLQIFEVADQVDPGNLLAMGSTLMHAAWGDCIAVAVMQMRGYSWSDVLFTHPLGEVGKRKDLPNAIARSERPPPGPISRCPRSSLMTFGGSRLHRARSLRSEWSLRARQLRRTRHQRSARPQPGHWPASYKRSVAAELNAITTHVPGDAP